MAGGRGRTWIVRVAAIILFVLVLEYAGLPLLLGFKASWRAIDGANLWVLAAAVICELASFYCFAKLSEHLLAQRFRPAFGTLLRINLTGNGVGHVLPGGGPAAAAVRFRLLDRVRVPTSSAVGVAALESAVQIIWYVIAFAVGLIIAVPHPQTHPFMKTTSVVAVALLAGIVGVFAVLMAKPDEIVSVIHGIATKVKFLPEERLRGFTANLIAQLRLLGTDREARRAAIWWGGGYWFLDALCLFLCIQALGFTPNAGGLITVYGLVNLLAMLPLTPGGLGIVEGVAVPALVSFGIGHQYALVGVLAWRLFQFWLPIPMAGVTWLWLRFVDFPKLDEEAAVEVG